MDTFEKAVTALQKSLAGDTPLAAWQVRMLCVMRCGHHPARMIHPITVAYRARHLVITAGALLGAACSVLPAAACGKPAARRADSTVAGGRASTILGFAFKLCRGHGGRASCRLAAS